MKAMVYRRYGSPDVLAVEDVPKPVPKDGEVLVRVRSAAVNPFDWHLLRGHPYIVRTTAGWRRPKRNIPGIDVAGVVEEVGPGVTALKPGDEVYGEKSRSCSEYVCGAAKLFVPKPANLTFEQAAAVPVAAVTALQALRDHGGLQAGRKVLINGASGGVGTFAVQLARSFGAEVTGVCSIANVDLVRSLGADHVIDYTKNDFTRTGERYDLIVDNAGNRSLLAMRRVLAPTGRLVGVGAPKGNWIAPVARIFWAQVLSRLGSQRMAFMLTDVTREDLLFLNGLIEAGTVTPVIDRRYPLSEVPDAIRYLETMRARGKVVITVGADSS
jgi:NADPH:quinone reductase-like Zn-dependent oxidoreductase